MFTQLGSPKHLQGCDEDDGSSDGPAPMGPPQMLSLCIPVAVKVCIVLVVPDAMLVNSDGEVVRAPPAPLGWGKHHPSGAGWTRGVEETFC